MRAVAVNGSPQVDRGNTAMVLAPFIEGMIDGGYQVELFYPSRLEITPCNCGKMYCWYRRPGECPLNDDMQTLYPRMRESDALILATPVYVPLPGRMQDVLNRLMPLIEPLLQTRAGRTRVRFREDVQLRKIALVSTGGWWERGNFDTVVHIVEEFAETVGVQFAGAVLRPHAHFLRSGGALTAEGEDVLEGVRTAGRELAAKGVIDGETLERISRPLIGQDELRRLYNDLL
ncbi:MAG: flavodoxin family protein [Bacillota bacterium]